MATILVTGGAGFVGSHVCQALIERGDTVVAMDSFSDYYNPQLKRDRLEQFKSQCTFYEVDISDYAAVEQIFKKHKLDKVCHLAAQAGVRYSIDHPFVYERTNTLGTLNILELCRHHNVKHLVFASSSSVYGKNTKIPFSETDPVEQPISLYAATKRCNELMAYAYHHLYGLQCTGLRFFTVYGPWGRPDMAYYSFTKAIDEDTPIKVFNKGNMRRDFTYITDVVAGVLAALDKAFPYEIINLGNSTPVQLLELIKCIERELGKKAQMNMLPMQPGDVHETYADIDKAKKLLGFEPKVSIEEGMQKFIAWYKDYAQRSNHS